MHNTGNVYLSGNRFPLNTNILKLYLKNIYYIKYYTQHYRTQRRIIKPVPMWHYAPIHVTIGCC